MNRILEELGKIEFHDIRVRSINIISDPEILLVVSFILYVEDLNDYQNTEMVFKEITKFEMINLFLDSNSDIEIFSFDYKFDREFDCKMTFLLGFGKPSLEMNFRCKEIEIVLNKI